jgi:succinyl-diaminopimelate desuccinylase
VSDDQGALLELTEQLLAIASPVGDEQRIADFVEQRIAAERPHALIRSGHSLCFAMRALEPERRTVMLVGHLDTVPQIEPNPVRRDGDRLYGLGASDMKAADALILELLFTSRTRPPRHNLIGVLYAKEEGPYQLSEMPLLLAAARDWFARTDLAICMEPTDNRIELGCLGTSHAKLTLLGQRAHSARPWQGVNAIHKGAGLLARLAARQPIVHEREGLRFVEVMSATMVSFRGARNVVPDRFEVNINYRFPPGKAPADVRAAFDELAAGEAEVEVVEICPAGRVCADNPLVQDLRAVSRAEVCAKQAWTDVGRLSHAGIDAINFGPGATAQAHQAGEWVSIAALRAAADTMRRWLWG